MFVGLHEWGQAHHVAVGNYTVVGCGTAGPVTLEYLGLQRSTDADCATWRASLHAAVARFRPDVVVVVMGLADLSPRKFANGRLLGIGEPTFDRRQVRRTIALTSVGPLAHALRADCLCDHSIHRPAHLPEVDDD